MKMMPMTSPMFALKLVCTNIGCSLLAHGHESGSFPTGLIRG